MENKIAKQREFFFSQKTKNVEYRIEKLKKLKKSITKCSIEVQERLKKALVCLFGTTYMINHLIF